MTETPDMMDYAPPQTGDGESAPSDDDRKFLVQARKDFLSSVKNRNHNAWRKEAEEDFEFVTGGDGYDSGQWSREDAERLKEENRPIITMNRLEPLVEGIVGAEVNNRQQVSYEAREAADKAVAQCGMEVAMWARDFDVQDEETDQFRNALICGMGWTVHAMNYQEDLDGRYTVISADPLGHVWDVDARRPNLSDARWIGYVETMGKEKFHALFPDEKGAGDVFGQKDFRGRDDDPAKYNTDYDDPNIQDVEGYAEPDKIRVLEYQCSKMEPAYRVLDPSVGKLSPAMEPREFSQMKQAVEAQGAVMARFGTPVDMPEDLDQPAPMVFRFLLQQRKVFYRAFITGNRLLGEVERSPWRNGFTRQCVTGRRDRRRNTWYGMVRAMKDPQRFTNKFMSAAIHHYNSNPKGGVFYEQDAVENAEDLRSQLAHPSPAIELAPGGLGKIQPIQPAQPSAALDRLIQIVSDMPPLVTGVSLEWLGVAGRDQPVGLEQTRKLATLSIVSPIFSSYKQYRKRSGRLLFDFIRDYFPISTIERVVSEEMQPMAKQLKQADTLKYDIHVDDAPLSPSIKATVFSVLKDMLQFLPPELAPVYLPIFLKNSPLPATLTTAVEAAMQPKPPDPMQQTEKLLELRKMAAEGAAKEADAALKNAKAGNEEDKPQENQANRMMELIDGMLNYEQTRMQMNAKSQNGGQAQ